MVPSSNLFYISWFLEKGFVKEKKFKDGIWGCIMLIFSWFLLKKALGMNIYIFLFYVQGEKE
jgi:hypothetical protein